jgi:hypothetical protein
MLPREPDFPALIRRKPWRLVCYFHYSGQSFKDTGHIVAGIFMRKAAAIFARRICATDCAANGADVIFREVNIQNGFPLVKAVSPSLSNRRAIRLRFGFRTTNAAPRFIRVESAGFPTRLLPDA